MSTGGSAALIEGLGIPVTEVADLTGFPECLEGRVKTLHPRVHAGLLADTRKPDHVEQLAELEVEPFELVVVNLYPFAATVASGAAADEVVEQIDIGGPSMVRAAAKNHPSVAVVVDPTAYGVVLEAVRDGGFTFEQRKALEEKSAGEISPHVLHMTATPIPRTLALTVYGDLDVSVLDEMPPGRTPVRRGFRAKTTSNTRFLWHPSLPSFRATPRP